MISFDNLPTGFQILNFKWKIKVLSEKVWISFEIKSPTLDLNPEKDILFPMTQKS